MNGQTSSKLRDRLLRDPEARKKLVRAMRGQGEESIELGERSYSVKRIRVFDRPAESFSDDT